jgi:CBS domain-containing protein
MALISDVMTADVQSIGPQESLQRAAQMMDRLNVGSLPVCAGGRLLGMVTDRDITVRGTAAGLTPQGASVTEVMSPAVVWCSPDDDSEQALRTMAREQLRRMPVIDGGKRLVGIVALGDLATKQSASVDPALRAISTPSEPDGGAHNA